jgi:hypothetical protein
VLGDHLTLSSDSQAGSGQQSIAHKMRPPRPGRPV